MRLKPLISLITATLCLAPLIVQAQTTEKSPWMVRARVVDLLFKNSQTQTVQSADVKAENTIIPEFDVSYFFTKNIATELVLTYPKNITINAGSGQSQIGKITALPPSLLLQYHFTNLGLLKPYVGAGINYTIFGNRNNFPGLPGVQVDKSSVGSAWQVGFDYMLDKNWGINLDLKYIRMSTEVKVVTNGVSLGQLTLNPWTPSIGVTYRF
jgi:outer membrane protein